MKKAVAAAMLSLSFISGPVAGQTAAPRRAWVRSIEFNGLQRYKPEHLVKSSGLKIGEPVDLGRIKTSARKLAETGLFRSVKDKYLVTNDQVDITFIVEEGARTLPVAFDNFLWFSERELREAIALEVPFFDGDSPETGTVNDSIAAALEKLLKTKGIPGRVEHMARFDSEAGSNREIVFSVRGLRMPICSIAFPGAAAVPEADLVRGAQALFDVDYSRRLVDEFARLTLLPLYQERGHMRASFRSAVAVAWSAPGCEGGVAVTLPVVEGAVYTIGAVKWPDSAPLPRRDLDEQMGIRPGDPADAAKLRAGLDAIRLKLEGMGFLRASTKASTTLDDATMRVTWRVAIEPGPQYRMGSLGIEGLSQEDSGRLQEMWKMKPGDPFEMDSLRRYIAQVMASPGRIPPDRRSMQSKVKPDHDTLTVDVKITFSAGSGAAP